MAGAVMLPEYLGSPFITPTTKALKDEIEDLKATIATLQEDMATLKSVQEDQAEELHYAQAKLAKLEGRRICDAGDIAKDRIADLFEIMKRDPKKEPLSLKQVAFVLKISKETARKLKPYIEKDKHFETGYSKLPGMGGNKGYVIKLHKFI